MIYRPVMEGVLLTYYRWETDIRAWRGGILRAAMEPFSPDWSYIDTKSCSPLGVPIPVINFRYARSAPRTDVIFSGSEWDPYSSRLRLLLRAEGIDFEEFPCRLLDKRSGELLSDDYAVVHFLGCQHCFDWEKSEYTREVNRQGRPVPSQIKKLALTHECTEASLPLFRLAEARYVILVHQRVRTALLESGVTGVEFLPLDAKWEL